jgi:hypothetical protein
VDKCGSIWVDSWNEPFFYFTRFWIAAEDNYFFGDHAGGKMEGGRNSQRVER